MFATSEVKICRTHAISYRVVSSLAYHSSDFLISTKMLVYSLCHSFTQFLYLLSPGQTFVEYFHMQFSFQFALSGIAQQALGDVLRQ